MVNVSSDTVPEPGDLPAQRAATAGMRPSGPPPYWQPGTHIWWHYRRRTWLPGHPETVRPMTVVRDDADGLVAWLAPGTPVLRPVLTDGRDLRAVHVDDWYRVRDDRALKQDAWRGPGILKVAPTGVPWSVWLFWLPDGTFRNWYVNLEDVHVRDELRVVTQDHVLDVVVQPDRSVRWKDEDELAAAVRWGRYDAADAKEFEKDARAVEEVVARWDSPFRDGWEDWQPDPHWPLPALPPGVQADF